MAPSSPLLQSKLVPPPMRPGVVQRPRLLARLEESRTPVVSVVAPAGWGKTTLLASWIDTLPDSHRVAWLQVGTTDDDPGRFWSYVVAAVGRVAPDLVTTATMLAGGPGSPPVEGVVPALLNDVAAAGDDLVLVLDDVHLVQDRELLESLEFAISHLPPNMQVVLSARADPDLPLARLRARGHLVELRADDLRFTHDSAARLLRAALDGAGDRLSADAVARLTARTEGWAAGLYLAALTLRGHADIDARVRAFAGDQRHVVDYLGAEVLEGLDADTRTFLLHTSVLDRFTAPLCAHVLQRAAAHEPIAQLERANLFLVPLDDRREWWRYHHLFADLLRHELDLREPGAAADLHRRAADWFEGQDLIDDAVRHRLSSGDPTAAAELVRTHLPRAMATGATDDVVRWLEALPRETVEGDAILAVVTATLYSFQRRFDPVPALLDAALAADPPDDVPSGFATIEAAVGVLRAGLLAFGPDRDPERAEQVGRDAVAREPQPLAHGYITARSMLGASRLYRGDATAALAPLREAYEDGRDIPNAASSWTGASGAYGLALLVDGQVDEAERVVRDVLGERAGLPGRQFPERHLAELTLGRCRHLAGAYEDAATHLSVGLDLVRFWRQPEAIVIALAWLADTRHRLGAEEDARRMLAEAYDVVAEEPVFALSVQLLDEVGARLRLAVRRRAARHGPLVEELTDRELQVLELLPTGLSLRMIGERLYLSINTVKGYAKTLYRKLDVSSRDEAVDVARELGLI